MDNEGYKPEVEIELHGNDVTTHTTKGSTSGAGGGKQVRMMAPIDMDDTSEDGYPAALPVEFPPGMKRPPMSKKSMMMRRASTASMLAKTNHRRVDEAVYFAIVSVITFLINPPLGVAQGILTTLAMLRYKSGDRKSADAYISFAMALTVIAVTILCVVMSWFSDYSSGDD